MLPSFFRLFFFLSISFSILLRMGWGEYEFYPKVYGFLAGECDTMLYIWDWWIFCESLHAWKTWNVEKFSMTKTYKGILLIIFLFFPAIFFFFSPSNSIPYSIFHKYSNFPHHQLSTICTTNWLILLWILGVGVRRHQVAGECKEGEILIPFFHFFLFSYSKYIWTANEQSIIGYSVVKDEKD